jgi:predicted double-glycine peptidase
MGLLLGAPASVWAAEVSFTPMAGTRMSVAIVSELERRWEHVARQSLDVSCGSAALATILRFQFDDPVTEDELIHVILERVAQKEVNRRGGFTLLDLKRVAMERGYTVHGYKLGYEQLAQLNTPALVPIMVRGYKHFAVFRGVVDDRVFLADPAFGNLIVRDFLFQSIWQGIVLVIEQQPGRPVPGKLMVTEGNALPFPTTGAFHTLMQQPELILEVNPDEF